MKRDIGTATDLCLSLGAIDAYIVDTEERKKAVWSARGAFLEAIKASTAEMDECDAVVPGNQVDAFIKFPHALAEELGGLVSESTASALPRRTICGGSMGRHRLL